MSILYKKRLLTLLTGSLLFSTACEKNLLDQPSPNLPDTSSFWKTQDDALRGLTAAYSGLQLNGTYRRWIHFLYDIRSDEGFSSSPWPELQNITKSVIADYNFVVNSEVWTQHYQAVNRANQVIDNVPAIQMTDEKLKTRILAEAHFLRALNYFNLVELYGPVPLATATSTADYRPPQAASEQEVWDLIIKDLEIAKSGLEASYSGGNVGRATKGAATALLGKVYMQNRQWAQASAQFQEVIGSGLYSLVPNYRDNFKHTSENNAESIFEVQFTETFTADREDDYNGASEGSQRGQFFGMPRGEGPNPLGWTDGEARPWLIDEFLKERTTDGKKDPRLAATVFFNRNRAGYPKDATDPVDQDSITYNSLSLAQRFPTDAFNRNRVYWRKYENDYWKNEEGYYSPINHRVIRYADVLLMQAEALNELGQTGAAIPLINLVRARVNLAPLMAMGQPELRMQIMHERVTELAGENTRWHDLKRWGLLETQAGVDQLKARDADFNMFVVGKSDLLPIPRNDIDIARLQQNVGW